MKVAVCLAVRDEAAVILEWICFHAAVGFDSFFIIDDHSTDETRSLAERASHVYDVRVSSWTGQEKGWQGTAYAEICRENATEFDWIAFVDADEFIVSTSYTSIKQLLQRHDGHAAIAVPWLMFGSSGHIEKPKGLIIQDFQMRAPDQFGPNHHIKSVVRPKLVRAGINPHAFKIEGSYFLPDETPAVWKSPGVLHNFPTNLEWRVHHYFTRSKAHWLKRMRRGQLGKITRTIEEFDAYDRNEVQDLAALRFLGETERGIHEISIAMATAVDSALARDPRTGVGKESLMSITQEPAGTTAAGMPAAAVEVFPSRSAQELTIEVSREAFVNSKNAHFIAEPPSVISVPLPVVRGASEGSLRFCGPFFLAPPHGAHPTRYPDEVRAPALMVSRIENVRLLPGGVALARATDGRPFIMAESFNSYWERSVHHAIVREAPDAFRLKETVRELAPLAGRYLYLDTQHTGHFGHFFVDVLTRAWGYRAAVNAGVSELKVLVPRLGSNFMTPFLCAAGIPEDAIVPLDRPVACQELFVATKCFQTHGYTTRTAVAFWQKLRDALDQGDGPERVYVSRSKTGNRKLTNEAEVEDLFASLGFAIVHPQEMSVADQVTCFANARFLAGPNGSNLFQLAFQRKLERALVINSPSMLRFSELMLQASYSSATTIHVGRTDNTDPHGAWYVPMDDLRRTVEEWMNGA